MVTKFGTVLASADFENDFHYRLDFDFDNHYRLSFLKMSFIIITIIEKFST